MASPDRLDPLSFAGCFAYLDSEIPPGVTLPAWRSRRSGSKRKAPQPRGTTTGGAGSGRGPRAPGSHPAGAWERALAAQRARPQPEEEPMSFPHSSALLDAWATTGRERGDTLRRLGREGRLAAYRRGEFDLDTCCLWASRYPREVPLLNGEFEFIALSTPEVRER